MRTSLVIPAAGRGLRFGGEVPKQLLPLAGRAVLLRSLDAFAGQVDEAVIAVSDDLRADVERLLIDARLTFPVRLTAGGATRQDSVYHGLLATNIGVGSTYGLPSTIVAPRIARIGFAVNF